jgi:hypothetical protein
MALPSSPGKGSKIRAGRSGIIAEIDLFVVHRDHETAFLIRLTYAPLARGLIASHTRVTSESFIPESGGDNAF